ncbi:Fungal specific transcription factor domain containing protein [Elaphomyces granulatus]
MTITSFGMPNRRGDAADKHSLRLQIIAPKDDVYGTSSNPSAARINSANLNVPPRVRLPPRSRTGCWSVQSHPQTLVFPVSFKCDESHPTCGQCTRLGHACDYNPRLSFRDDTSRVMERMSAVSTAGNAVWDPSYRGISVSSPALHDSFPPFATLTCDEERERKAETSSPGTYHVVVNPDSFSGLPEYTDDSIETLNFQDLFLRRGSTASSMISDDRRDQRESSRDRKDPNVVILPRFEDSSRRPSSANLRTSRQSPTSDGTPCSSPSVSVQSPGSVPAEQQYVGPLDQIVQQGGQDAQLLLHFRDVVWKQIQGQSFCRDSPAVEIIERVAATFRPLFHAMMALSALSLAHQDGQNILALQHYQLAFPSLQTSLRHNQDLCSDGLFLTHFLLLVYELAAAEPGGSNLWSHHISQLLRISFMRISKFGTERYPFIVWWVCNIDLYALLSGAGTGEFLGGMLKNSMLPEPEFQLYPLGPDGYSVIYPEEVDSLPAILRLHHETFILASRLGFLAADLRKGSLSPTFWDGSISPTSFSDAIHQSNKLMDIQHGLRILWGSANAVYLCQHIDSLPQRSREILQQSWTLYHASLIYSYTSMWPGQRRGTSEEHIEQHASMILQVAESIVNAGRFDLRFIIFPLFMAGTASSSSGRKMRAMDLISSMEKDGIGRNATTTRHVLQIVCRQRTQQLMCEGYSLDVDWAEIMIEQGLQIVNFGL